MPRTPSGEILPARSSRRGRRASSGHRGAAAPGRSPRSGRVIDEALALAMLRSDDAEHGSGAVFQPRAGGRGPPLRRGGGGRHRRQRPWPVVLLRDTSGARPTRGEARGGVSKQMKPRLRTNLERNLFICVA